MTRLPHPKWCDPLCCDGADPNLPVRAGGAHRSAPAMLHLPLILGDQLTVMVQLRQEIAAWPTDVLVAVQHPGDPHPTHIRLDGVRAALAAVLPLLAKADVTGVPS